MKNAFRSCTTFLVGPPFKYPSRGSDRYYWKKKKKKWGRHIFCRKWRWIMAAALEEEPDQKPIWGCLLVKNHFGNPPSPFDLLWAFRTLKFEAVSSLFTASKTSFRGKVSHVSHVRNHSSRHFSRFFFQIKILLLRRIVCYSHWFTPWMQSSNVMFNCFEMQNSNCCISSQGFSSGLRNLILRVINTLVLKVAPILLYFCAVPYFGQTFQRFRKINTMVPT